MTKTLIVALCLVALFLVGMAILTMVKKIYSIMGEIDRTLSVANRRPNDQKDVLRGVEHLIALGSSSEKSRAELVESSHRLEEAVRRCQGKLTALEKHDKELAESFGVIEDWMTPDEAVSRLKLYARHELLRRAAVEEARRDSLAAPSEEGGKA